MGNIFTNDLCCKNSYVIKTENNLDLIDYENNESKIKSKQKNELLENHLNHSFRINSSNFKNTNNTKERLKELENKLNTCNKIKLKILNSVDSINKNTSQLSTNNNHQSIVINCLGLEVEGKKGRNDGVTFFGIKAKNEKDFFIDYELPKEKNELSTIEKENNTIIDENEM
jgi:hypothetical protein